MDPEPGHPDADEQPLDNPSAILERVRGLAPEARLDEILGWVALAFRAMWTASAPEAFDDVPPFRIALGVKVDDEQRTDAMVYAQTHPLPASDEETIEHAVEEVLFIFAMADACSRKYGLGLALPDRERLLASLAARGPAPAPVRARSLPRRPYHRRRR